MKVAGIVKKFSGRGRRLGFPTANIEIERKMADGLYLGYTLLEERKLPSLVYVGDPEMYGDKKRRLESYILDFLDRDLYGSWIEVEIAHKLRDNMSFQSEEALVAQMKKDEKEARKYFASLA